MYMYIVLQWRSGSGQDRVCQRKDTLFAFRWTIELEYYAFISKIREAILLVNSP